MRQYIGARYTIEVYENSLDPSSAEWEANTHFEPITLVTFNNSSYLSKKDVPASVGNPAANKSYWVVMGSYNGQIAELQSAVAYIEAHLIKTYATVADMIADEKLVAGNFAHTLGYYDKYDGGGALYFIDTTSEGISISFNSLYANIITEKSVIHSRQAGAYGDGINDDTSALQSALTNYDTVILDEGTYLTSDKLYLKERNTLEGVNKSKCILTTNTPHIMLENLDEYSQYVTIRNITILGNYQASVGINFKRTTIPDLTYVDMHIRIEHVRITRCTYYCVQIGTNDSERAWPCTYIHDLTLEQFTGGGLFLSSRCTDSTVEDVWIGGAGVSTKPGLRVEGYNIHFNNVKVCWCGSAGNPQIGVDIDGSTLIDGNIEVQDTFGYGLRIHQGKYINLNVMMDRCGDAGSALPAIFINDGGWCNITGIVSNLENQPDFLTDSVCAIKDSKDVTFNIVQHSSVPRLFSADSSLMSGNKNVVMVCNGNAGGLIVPEFTTTAETVDPNGITYEVIHNQIRAEGTATAQVEIPLVTNTKTMLLHDKNAMIVNTNCEDGYFVFRLRTSGGGTSYITSQSDVILFSDDYYIDNIVYRIPSGTVIDRVITCDFKIFKNE